MRFLPLPLLLLVGCFGTEIPPQKPAEDPLANLPPPKPTTDASKIEDRPNDRKPAKPDEKLTKDVINRATRQAANCPQIHTEGPFGDFSLTLVLGSSGKVEEVRLPSDLTDKPIGKCIAKAYQVESFPPWQGSPVNETVKLTLKKADEPKADPKADPKKK